MRPSAPGGRGAEAALLAEAKRLRAENAKLRQRIADEYGDGEDGETSKAERWGAALLGELRAADQHGRGACAAGGGNPSAKGELQQPQEGAPVVDVRRFFSLKSELCLAVRRRRQLEDAVKARHAGLERLASQGGCVGFGAIESALADGAGVAAAPESARGAPAPGTSAAAAAAAAAAAPPTMTMEEALEAEEHLAQLRPLLATTAATWNGDESERKIILRAASAVGKCSDALLRHAVELPAAQPQRAAAARARLRRILGAGAAGRASAGASGAGGMARSCESTLGTAFTGVRPVHVPEGLVFAWRDALEASLHETVAKDAVKQCVARMVDVVASWELKAQRALAQLSAAAPRGRNPNVGPRNSRSRGSSRGGGACGGVWDGGGVGSSPSTSRPSSAAVTENG